MGFFTGKGVVVFDVVVEDMFHSFKLSLLDYTKILFEEVFNKNFSYMEETIKLIIYLFRVGILLMV